MSIEMTKGFAFALCTTDGGTAIAVQKRGSGVKNGTESFSDGLETEYWPKIGRETWGDNNVRGDIKVDNKVDNKVWNDTVNDTVKHPQIKARTSTPYNTRTSPVILGVNRKDLVSRTGVAERTMTRSLFKPERSGKKERRGRKKTDGHYLIPAKRWHTTLSHLCIASRMLPHDPRNLIPMLFGWAECGKIFPIYRMHCEEKGNLI